MGVKIKLGLSEKVFWRVRDDVVGELFFQCHPPDGEASEAGAALLADVGGEKWGGEERHRGCESPQQQQGTLKVKGFKQRKTTR
jgi:hypothetical protein